MVVAVLTGGSPVSTVDSTAVEAPDLVASDPLQQEVDPKPMVSSRCKGPVRRRYNPTHMPVGGRADVHHILCAWCELPESVDTYTLCRNSQQLQMAQPGDKRARSTSPTANPSQCQTKGKA